MLMRRLSGVKLVQLVHGLSPCSDTLREYQTKQMPPFTFGELKNTTGTNLYDVDEDYPAGPEVQQPLPE